MIAHYRQAYAQLLPNPEWQHFYDVCDGVYWVLTDYIERDVAHRAALIHQWRTTHLVPADWTSHSPAFSEGVGLAMAWLACEIPDL
jgi:hypothetical protein